MTEKQGVSRAPEQPDTAFLAAEKIFALFKNASYFAVRNDDHKRQMLEGWAEIIRTTHAPQEPAAAPPERRSGVERRQHTEELGKIACRPSFRPTGSKFWQDDWRLRDRRQGKGESNG